MQARKGHDYIFGRFYLDTRERILLCDGKPVPITLKAFDTLFVLVQSSGHIVEKVELMKQVWPNAFVEEGNLTQHIYKLRQILGVRADGRQYIETVPRRGYRFTAATSKSRPESEAFREIGKLPAEKQDAIASRILAQLADEQQWSSRFNSATDQQWDRLSELARQEINAGDTDPRDDVFLLERL